MSEHLLLKQNEHMIPDLNKQLIPEFIHQQNRSVSNFLSYQKLTAHLHLAQGTHTAWNLHQLYQHPSNIRSTNYIQVFLNG